MPDMRMGRARVSADTEGTLTQAIIFALERAAFGSGKSVAHMSPNEPALR